MSQVVFKLGDQVTAIELNKATQGYKFIRSTTYAGSTGSPVGSASVATVTWTVASGTTALFIRVCGGGGGGGMADGSINYAASSGGGGGGYSEGWLFAGQFGASAQLDIGLGGLGGTVNSGSPGGSSIFIGGPLGQGGFGGIRMPPSPGNTSAIQIGGYGGGGFYGSVNAYGDPGGAGFVIPTNLAISGRGGKSAFGGAGGLEQTSNVGLVGDNGKLYGGGGSGALSVPSAGVRNGGNGAPGFVVVYEYA